MKITSMCTLCSVFEGLKLAWVGPMLLTVTGILAVADHLASDAGHRNRAGRRTRCLHRMPYFHLTRP